jgi:hypothetical protein
MSFLDSLATAFSVTPFDVFFVIFGIFVAIVSYYFISLHQVYESAFGALVGFSIYILFSVLLTQNPSLGTMGGLFPFQFSVFLVSGAVYLIFILAIVFPSYGGLMIHEPESQALYTVQYIFVSLFFFFVMGAVVVYMIEQKYVFRVGSILTPIQEWSYYLNVVRNSQIFQFYMQYRDVIIPLAVLLMVYKLLFANIITAMGLSLWYNISRVGFYRIRNDSHYRVEFH